MEEKNKNSIYKTTMIIVVTSIITFMLTTICLYNYLTDENVLKSKDSRLETSISYLNKIIKTEYLGKVNEDELIDGALKGYVEGLGDDYSEYYTEEEMENITAALTGNYVGIGIYMAVNTNTNEILIIGVIDESPAQKAGIKSGDVLKSVDSIECTGDDLSQVATNIKGEEGSIVNLKLLRNDEVLEFNVKRESIKMNPIKSEVIENTNIGYIKMLSFDTDTSIEFKEHLQDLQKKNIKSLIIDLRDNGGGIVDESLKIADYFTEKDATLLITENNKGKISESKAKEDKLANLDIIILINENSASATEIFAAALKENKEATIVGKKSFGKGVIQEFISLRIGGGIKLTVQEFFTPLKNKINKVGIVPDVEVDLSEESKNAIKLEKEKDEQLQKAIELLKKEY